MTEYPTPKESGELPRIPPEGIQTPIGKHTFLFAPQQEQLFSVYEDLTTRKIITHETSPKDILTIGSAQDNTIVLPKDNIAAHHLQVSPTEDAWQVQKGADLKDKLFLRDVTPLTLQPNDKLPPLEWMQTPTAPYARFRFRIAGNPYRIEVTRFEESVLLLAGGDTTLPLYNGRLITIGRSLDNDIAIEDAAYVSRYHLALLYLNNRLYVQDRGSTNGTSLALVRL